MAKAFSESEWQAVADFVKSEKERRAAHPHRKQLERDWKEIDRQLAMEPKPRHLASGATTDWLPNQELPLQATALEVILADANRMKFPRGRDWYEAHCEITKDYEERFAESSAALYAEGTSSSEPIRVDQETADVLVKATLDHYHGLYDFRGHWDLLDGEAIKYGTYVGYVREVLIPKFDINVSGAFVSNLKGPVMVPHSIKDTFLDDTPMSVMHEGVATSGALVRRHYKKLDDLKRAVGSGGNTRGWMASALAALEPKRGGENPAQREHLEMLEWEGDILVPQTGDPIFMPSVRLVVAIGNGAAKVVRYQDSVKGSYFVGHYMRERRDSPYGVSPLMKGRPIQEAATEVFNRLSASAILNAEPPTFYDKYDTALAAAGGPSLAPGSSTGCEDPSKIKDLQIGDPAALLQVYIALLKQYEDITAVNAPRIGAQGKSHTTAFGIDVEQSRGQVRTEDYVGAQINGPVRLVLEKEYAIIKEIMRTPQPVLIDDAGIEGWRTVNRDMLPDRVAFTVHGSLGPLNEREKAQAFVGATQQAMSLIAAATQLGLPAPQIDINEVVKQLYEQAGINDANRFLRAPGGTESLPGPAQVGASVQALAPLLPGQGRAPAAVAA